MCGTHHSAQLAWLLAPIGRCCILVHPRHSCNGDKLTQYIQLYTQKEQSRPGTFTLFSYSRFPLNDIRPIPRLPEFLPSSLEDPIGGFGHSSIKYQCSCCFLQHAVMRCLCAHCCQLILDGRYNCSSTYPTRISLGGRKQYLCCGMRKPALLTKRCLFPMIPSRM